MQQNTWMKPTMCLVVSLVLVLLMVLAVLPTKAQPGEAGALAHLLESEFLEEKYAELTKTLDPQARERVAREITDYLFEEFTSIPLITVFHEVAVNPKVVAGWTWPGQGAGRTTHFHLIKAVQ